MSEVEKEAGAGKLFRENISPFTCQIRPSHTAYQPISEAAKYTEPGGES